jgi:hypothetical protein
MKTLQVTIKVDDSATEKAWNRVSDAIQDSVDNGDMAEAIKDSLEIPTSLAHYVTVEIV